MKGIQKAMQRTPHMFTSKIGMSNKSSDPEFDDMNRKFAAMEKACDQLLKDAVIYRTNVQTVLSSQTDYARFFAVIFQPISPNEEEFGSEQREKLQATGAALEYYQSHANDLKESLQPELELIDSRVIAPAKELQTVMKQIRKTITKRDHKLLDYDRHNNSLKKLKDKQNKTLKDEQNLFKLESDFEAATAEYEHYSGLLKTDLPRFFELVGEFIYPLSTSLFFMQLNIFYLSMEKFKTIEQELERQGIAEPGTGGDMGSILEVYMAKRGDAGDQISQLTCVRGAKSTSMFVRQYNEKNGIPTAPSIASRPSYGRADSSNSTSKYGSPATAAAPSPYKQTPPSFNSQSAANAAPPPAYSGSPQGGSAAYGSATKRAPPPPPPPMGSKPKATQFVIALYDYAAQADGDLSFNAGDRIELVKRTDSENDWWTGRLNGQEGVFPGNYVQMA